MIKTQVAYIGLWLNLWNCEEENVAWLDLEKVIESKE